MMPSIPMGLLALVAFSSIAVVPLACQSGGVGDPCAPEDEYDPEFAGFNLGQEYIESRSFQCSTRICLVNHVQGRVSCPLGQPESRVRDCTGPNGPREEVCDAARGERCVESTSEGSAKRYVCHVPGACQSADAKPSQNEGKDCCIPGTDKPVTVPVCGQCDSESRRSAAEAVYCSCRCGVADGEPDEPNFPFCACPDGFTCSQIRPKLGFGDERLNGKYCIKEGSEYVHGASCGVVAGNHEFPCNGVGAL